MSDLRKYTLQTVLNANYKLQPGAMQLFISGTQNVCSSMQDRLISDLVTMYIFEVSRDAFF